MTLFCKLILNGIVLGKLGRRCTVTSQRYFRHSCLFTPIRGAWKTYSISQIRVQTTKALKEKISTFEPTRKSKKQSELRNLFALAIPQKWRLLSAVVFLIISSSVTMVVPFCVGKAIDAISSLDKDMMQIKLKDFSIILLGIFIIGGVSNFCRVYLMSTAGHTITQALRKSAYAAILRQETAMFDKRSTGELVGRLSGDAQLVSSALTSNVSDGLRSAIMSITGISMMLYVSPKLTLVGLSIIPPVAAMAIVYGRFLKKISTAVQDSIAVLNTTAEERISNIRTVKAFAQETREVERYNLKLQNVLRLCYKESFYRGTFFGLNGFSGNIIIFSVLYYGGVMVSESTITIGSLSAFLLYAAYVGIAMNGLSSFYSELNKALGANARIFELIQRQPAIPIEGGQVLNKELSGNIEFKNVSFAYPTREGALVLKNINLYIPKCTVTAIVGSSGSGKSTIASLLLRLYDPTEGCILFDDHNLRCLDPIWVKSQISIVSQEPTLFSGTIKENISYGVDDATEYAVEKAAQEAHVSEFTQRMAEGLNTIIGERGITLSGGQRQRVAIARAIIRKPKILILDEATSALDAQSENLIREALEKIAHGRTVLTIAHRLSTIKNASNIVVLYQGEIQETGTFDKLMSLENSYFRKLVKHQAFM